MIKPIFFASALALTAPALAQTQTEGTTPGGGTQTPGQQTVSGNTPGTSGTEEQVSTADTSVQAAGTTSEEANEPGQHHEGSQAAGTTAGARIPTGSGTVAQPGRTGVATSGTTTSDMDAHAAHGGTAASTGAQAGTTSGAGAAIGSTASGAADSGTVAAAGATGQAGASAGFTGVGGPSGDVLEVAQEMLGDANRVQQVMRGGDSGMKASDLLNQAMLTLIQSNANTPR